MKIKRKVLFMLGMIAILILAGTTITYGAISKESEMTKDYIYLSDIPYVQDKSFAASGHSILLDKNEDSDLLTLKVNDMRTPFLKGICAWATSEIVYDLRDYDFDYFTSYLGVDISEQNTYFNTGVKFLIYTSNDGENWGEPVEKVDYMDASSEAKFIKVDIKEVDYLKLVADDNSNNWWANWYDEAVYANAKLIKENYIEDNTPVDFIKTIEEYDEIIKAKNTNHEITEDYELTLLQREFVNNVGYEILQAFVKYSDENYDVILWLMNDAETLRLYLAGGKPEGSYANSITVLSKLYAKYKNDLENETITQYGTPLKELYRTMMLSISLTHSGNVYLWIDGVCHSDPITRYEIYKKLHEEELIECKIFESLTVEEMRWVMNTIIDDEEIEWLNDYTRNVKNGATGPYSYIKYTFGYNYWLDKYYDLANYEQWDEKYNLSKYNITYQKGQPKLWIVFEEGAVCGGLSKTGSCVWGSYKGLPNTCVSQPGHCAYIYYSQNENGDGIWGLGNDVSGWGQSGKTEHLNVRMPNDWGVGSYTSGWNASYVLLAQAAQNEYEKYEKAEEILMLADVYKDDSQKLEEIYRKALEVEPIHFDAWLGLVNLYKTDETKTEADYYHLAEEIGTILTYYPRPMYDLLKLIEPYMTSTGYQVKFTMLQTRTLTTATQVTGEQSIQATAVKQVANALLGNIDKNIATFSFDGDNAGKIILSSRYDGNDVHWDYSLDGGITWIDTEEHNHKLTSEELASITAETDIKVHIFGVDYSEDNIFTIDIKNSAGLPTNLYANDLENRIIATTDTMEWRYSDKDDWTSYRDALPDLTGNKTVTVRVGGTGVYLPSSNTATYTFTEDNQLDTKKYIPISHLSIASVSSEEPGHSGSATMAIDGNINTRWITNWNGQDTNRYITIKLDAPVYLSAVEYVPIQGKLTNGVFKDVKLSVSLDGENWTEVANITGWSANTNSKTIELEEPVQTQYVKLEMPANYSQSGGTANYASATMINLFEDITKRTNPTAGIKYDIVELTNQNVTVQLVDASTDITITNNDGSDTYVFTENGEFTFEFVDVNGNKGSTIAKVDWIDKIPPTATISYNITETTNQDVTATLANFSEEVTIINNSGSETYTFSENGTFTFEFVDKAGNIGKVTAIVDWIKKVEEEEDEKITSGKYNIEDNFISRIAPETTISQFKKNVQTKQEMIFTDKNGTILKEDDIITTNTRLQVGKTLHYTLIVIGDIDENGKIGATDLAKLKLHCIEQEVLTGVNWRAADVNGDGKITVTDLAQIKLVLIGLMEIE